MSPARTRAAEIRSRWNKNGIKCNLSLDDLEPLFSIYFDTPKGKVIVLDKSKEVTHVNIKSFSHTQYKTHRFCIVQYREAKGHHDSLKRFNQPIKVSVEDIFQLIFKSNKGYKTFTLKDNSKPVTLLNLSLLVGSRSESFLKLKKVAEQRLVYWRNLGLTPLFTATQLTKHIEQMGYKRSSCRKIIVIDKTAPFNLKNIDYITE
ncbi:MAG: hypothetical protein HRT52_21550 [Colwellia sp.]|nr:hypothetical protein [Colwellia sp.]